MQVQILPVFDQFNKKGMSGSMNRFMFSFGMVIFLALVSREMFHKEWENNLAAISIVCMMLSIPQRHFKD